ncbi:heterokaryon incompatibility protein-domain-containing protein [Astrocystis sublimbata]|nr:heterokaryon incompatibility protein-domain-containing protein [Astrocystis sublimbata]
MERFFHDEDIHQYSAFPERPPYPPHIRLLRISLDGSENEDIIQCVLQSFPFEPDTTMCPPFTALSYTWGPAENAEDDAVIEHTSRHMVVNRRFMRVSTNLYHGLREIRRQLRQSTRAGLYLWVDAICIDQDNYAEKGEQVDLMGDIFTRAEGVIIWLGAGILTEDLEVKSMARKIEQLVHDIQRDAGHMPAVGYWQSKSATERRQVLDRHGLPARGQPQWVHLWKLLSRRWFSRIWAIQELVLAAKVEFVCGSVAFSLDELAMCADLLYWEIRNWPEVTSHTPNYDPVVPMRNTFVIEDLYKEGGRFKYYDRVILVGPDSNASSPWHFLLNLLYSSRKHRATVGTDKVYALLGLIRTKAGISSQALERFIHADYEKSTVDLFWEVMQGAILDMTWLGPLVLVEMRPDLDTQHLSSYVPDFTAAGDQFGIGWQVLEGILPSLKHISSQAPTGGIPTFSGKVLQAQGVRLDTVLGSSEPFKELFDSGTNFTHGLAIIQAVMDRIPSQSLSLEILLRAFVVDDKRVRNIAKLEQSFACFLLCRILQYHVSSGANGTALDIIQNSPLSKGIVSISEQHPGSIGQLMSQFVESKNNDFDEIRKVLFRAGQAFEHIFSCHYLDRALLRTVRDCLGTCYSSTRPGDELWFLAHAPCPFVLRRVGDSHPRNRFRLVGWAYLQGFPSEENVYTDWVRVEID